MHASIPVDKVTVAAGQQAIFKTARGNVDSKSGLEVTLRVLTRASTNEWFDSRLKLSKVALKQGKHCFEGTWESHPIKGEYPVQTGEGAFSHCRKSPMLAAVPVKELHILGEQQQIFSDAESRPSGKPRKITLAVQSPASINGFEVEISVEVLVLQDEWYEFTGKLGGSLVKGYYWSNPGGAGNLEAV